MTQHRLPGDPPLEITLRRSARARRFSLRVSRLDGRVTLSMPARAREAEALAFAREKEGWLRQAVLGAGESLRVDRGMLLPFEGRQLTVTGAPVRAVRVEGDAILVPQGVSNVAPRVLAFLKLAARQRLQAASETHAAAIGCRFTRLTLRDTRSRWGSCTVDGQLMYSWRLIMAPPDVLDYVAAHEVAHLVEMNHSPDFWAVVAGLMPDYARHRRWLRTHGPTLHRVDFGG
ncbi:SprT family zinc-dependent metalloprotease [Defluviimonas aestuarii]|uniref:M48 family metallopeptidase n=1 Tax=Albidovulum aestuarii TaxID=1130726 RepID=UPI00249CEB4D|nr:SprT family zinc-dependent metalloprotease [Defluviimonas aestuarii]MDI3336660.1 SprT family zinc-dependent metalloprotease [Defluviimonas aestuarii]